MYLEKQQKNNKIIKIIYWMIINSIISYLNQHQVLLSFCIFIVLSFLIKNFNLFNIELETNQLIKTKIKFTY